MVRITSSARIVRRTLRGSMDRAECGVHRRQFLMQPGSAFLCLQPFQFIPHPGSAFTSGGTQPSVTARMYCPVPPTSRGSFPGPVQFLNDFPRLLLKVRQAQNLIRVGDVDQMMGDLLPLLERRLGGADVHAAVKQPRSQRR